MLPQLALMLLLAACVSLATWLDPRLQQQTRDGGFLASFMGEGRRLFANHFFTRSDVYFHSGYYPSIFDQAGAIEENHLAEGAGAREVKLTVHDAKDHVCDDHCHGKKDDHGFLGKPKDPLDAFTRHFFVTQHTHLTEKGPNAAKEILPWLKLAAQFDPARVESYTVAAYWLRDLGKKEEAEQFLREGLRHNPQSYELLFELGRCYFEKSDVTRARNLWEASIARWREQENLKSVEQQNRFMAGQIVNHLARLEARAGNRDRAISWLGIVRKLSPHPEQIDQRIAEVRAGGTLEAP